MLSTWTYTILLNNLCHHGRTNINAWAQVSTQSKMVIKIWCYFISKHHPFKPLKLKKLAYVRYLSSHYHFRDFPIQFIDAVHRIGPYLGLKFKAIIPKSLWGVRLIVLPTRTLLQFPYISLSSIGPWSEKLILS